MKKLMMVLAGVLLLTGFAMAQVNSANVTVNVYRDISLVYDAANSLPDGTTYWMIQGGPAQPIDHFRWIVSGEAQFTFAYDIIWNVVGSSVTLSAKERGHVPPGGYFVDPGVPTTGVVIPGTFGNAGTVDIWARCVANADPLLSGANIVSATCSVSNYAHF